MTSGCSCLFLFWEGGLVFLLLQECTRAEICHPLQKCFLCFARWDILPFCFAFEAEQNKKWIERFAFLLMLMTQELLLCMLSYLQGAVLCVTFQGGEKRTWSLYVCVLSLLKAKSVL